MPQCHSSAIYLSDFIFPVFVREQSVQSALEPAWVRILPWKIAETFREIEIQGCAASGDGFYHEMAGDACPLLDQGRKRVARR